MRPPAGWSPRTTATRRVMDLLPLNLGSPESCRGFPLSPSEGERVGERGPYWPLGISGRRIHWGLLSPALSSLGGGEGEAAASHAGTSLIQRQWGRGEGADLGGQGRKARQNVGASLSPTLRSKAGEGEPLARCSRPPGACKVQHPQAQQCWKATKLYRLRRPRAGHLKPAEDFPCACWPVVR